MLYAQSPPLWFGVCLIGTGAVLWLVRAVRRCVLSRVHAQCTGADPARRGIGLVQARGCVALVVVRAAMDMLWARWQVWVCQGCARHSSV